MSAAEEGFVVTSDNIRGWVDIPYQNCDVLAKEFPESNQQCRELFVHTSKLLRQVWYQIYYTISARAADSATRRCRLNVIRRQ